MPFRNPVSLAILFLVVHPVFALQKPLTPKPPEIVQPTPLDPKQVPKNDLADWTPRPATGKAEPWEKAKDPDWDDDRFRSMNTGPFQDATFRYPIGNRQELVFKGTAIRLGEMGDAGVIFDRSNMRMAVVWTGGWLHHSNRRFGLLNTPTPIGTLHSTLPMGAGWADPDGSFDTKGTGTTAPLPKSWARYRGLHLHADRVVLEYTVGERKVLETAQATSGTNGGTIVVRTVAVYPGKKAIVWQPDGPGSVPITFKPFDVPLLATRSYGGTVKKVPGLPIGNLVQPGPKRWGEPIITKLVRGNNDGALAIDTLTIPYKNRFNALFFCTGLDFLPDGRIAVCTCHGDVWLVTVNEEKGECAWQRYATGLYHPLGLKVVEGKVIVLERGQLTRLHDENHDGEADFYENVNNDWHTGSGEHSYDTCLETDPDGNFYFFKTGDPQTPTGGCLMRVAKDGSKAEIFSTGFRHPIGMGMSSSGILTGADQEGNWMPSTRIDEYKKGGFYGDMRAHHRKTPPTIYDQPLCWLPREVDNSAGGQVWVPKDVSKLKGAWKTLAGLPLHLSYGRCQAFVLLRQETSLGTQGGVWNLGLRFLSGVCRGRFHDDGNLYLCGLNGWQTAAQADGCLQRVRATGKPLRVPVKWQVVPDGMEVTFSCPLDRKSVENPQNYRAAWWGYRWVADYGSKRWKISDPNVEGQDDVTITSAKLSNDGRTVRVTIPGMRPVMQFQLGVHLQSTDGAPVVGSIYGSVHTVGK